MRGNPLQRRVAAWVLTLPGPFAAHSHEAAAREALLLFDPTASQDAFEAALHHWGYAIRRESAASFSIGRHDEASARPKAA